MELQNEVLTGKTVTINEATLSNKPPSFEEQPKVYRARKILLILIGILLVLCFVNFVLTVHSHASNNSLEGQLSTSSSQLVSILISSIYYGFGFLVTYRYYQTGLLVFAWLGFISLLLMLVIVTVILIDIVIIIAHLGFANALIVTIIFIVICFAASLLQIFIVRYAFLLSKLLRSTKRFTIEQI